MQGVADQFDVHVRCLFQKQSNFESGLESLRAEGLSDLATYLGDVRRLWTETFLSRRVALEHSGWLPPHSTYVHKQGAVKYVEPQIDGTAINTYASKAFSRIAFFVENILWFCYQHTLCTLGFSVVEIPRPDRDPKCPRRFALWMGGTKDLPWMIHHSEDEGF